MPDEAGWDSSLAEYIQYLNETGTECGTLLHLSAQSLEKATLVKLSFGDVAIEQEMTDITLASIHQLASNRFPGVSQNTHSFASGNGFVSYITLFFKRGLFDPKKR